MNKRPTGADIGDAIMYLADVMKECRISEFPHLLAETEPASFIRMAADALTTARQALRLGAEQRQAEIVEMLRTTPRAMGVLISIDSSQDIARLAGEIESRWPKEGVR